MSAYMLEDEKFQDIADWFITVFDYQGHPYDYWSEIRSFLGLSFSHNKTYEQIEELIQMKVRDLYNLNRLALVTRYSFEYEKHDDKKFTPKKSLKMNLKSIISLLINLRYQCSEYITCETKIYKSLDTLIGNLCESFFHKYKDERK